MVTILLIAALTIVFVVGMTIFTNDIEFQNAVRYASLSAALNNEQDPNTIDGGTYTIQINFTGAITKKTKLNLSSGTTLSAAINLAGGVTSEADLHAINLNYKLVETGSFYIAKISDKEKVCINSGTTDDLMTLSGIGSISATRIIDYRTINGEFLYLEQIMKVSGIGAVTFDNIKDQIKLW